MSIFNKVTKTFQWGNHTVTLETGEIARQASGAVVVDIEGTVVLCVERGGPVGARCRAAQHLAVVPGLIRPGPQCRLRAIIPRLCIPQGARWAAIPAPNAS